MLIQGGQGGIAEKLTFEQKSEEIKKQASRALWGVVQAGKKHCKGPEAGVSSNTACSAREEAQADNVDLWVVDLQEAFKTF